MALRHPLPYAFAKAHTLLVEDDGEALVLHCGPSPSPAALGELTRLFEIDRIETAPAEALALRIARAYAGGE